MNESFKKEVYTFLTEKVPGQVNSIILSQTSQIDFMETAKLIADLTNDNTIVEYNLSLRKIKIYERRPNMN